MKTLLLFLITFSFFVSETSAQTVTGEWYGIGYVKKDGEYHNYLSEMILKQTGTKVTGTFNYYFMTDSFKTKVSGNYYPKLRQLELNATPILNYQARNKNGAECPMEGDFILMVSMLESTLTGQFNPIWDYRIVCPAITIKFVKYIPDTTTKEAPVEEVEVDTIPEPIVKVAPPVVKKDTAKAIAKDTVKTRPTTKDTIKTNTIKDTLKAAPIVIKKDTVKTAPPVVVKKDTAKIAPPAVAKKDTVKQVLVARDTVKPAVPLRDTVKQSIVSKDTSVRPKPITVIQRPVNPNEKYIRELYRRSFELVAPEIEVDSDSLRVSIYDNGEIDNDTISVFYNRKPVLLQKMLSDKPLTFNLKLRDTATCEISMFADNLGRIPPNTAIAIIYAGDQRFELTLSSSLVKNSTIRFKRKRKVVDPKNIN